MESKTVTIEEVIETINKALADNEKPPELPKTKNIQGTPTDQLPPYVAEIENDLFEKLIDNYGRLNGLDPTEETIACIRYIARAEAVRRHLYRKLAMSRLDEFLADSENEDPRVP